MTHLLEFGVGDGTDAVITFEVDAGELPGDLVLASTTGPSVAGRMRTSLADALDQLKPSLVKISEVVREMAPAEASLEFGLKMGGETGVIVAKGTAEANFKLSLVWK